MPLSSRKPLNIKALVRSVRALAVMCSIALAGCQSLPSDTPDRSTDTSRAVGLEREPEWLSSQIKPREYSDIWERMRDGFKLQDEIGINPRIERVRLWYASNPKHVDTVSERSAPYIHYIVERLAERDMPMELALLPVIESAYDPLAYSSAHAVGLWQFIPSTGRHYNLRQTNWYDGRRDVTASTQAALNYLSRLHEMFNGDWLLALAAYNAGEGRISRAIERNEKLGLPSDYWNLSLPKETEDYVPKLLALSQVILTPEAYGVSLSPIANEPYFEQIAIKQHMDLARVAKLADLDEQELLQLNPAYKRGITLDGPQHLLVPTEKAELLSANLALMKPQELVDWQSYTVRSGDSLHAIANRHHLSVNMLKDVNRLSSNNLNIGQVLTIPAKPGTAPNEPLYQQRSTTQSVASRTYRVKNGDNLWQIARNNQVAVHDLKRWNKLQGNQLKVGQVLTLAAADSSPQATGNARSTTSSRDKATYYRVQHGDSLYVIAKRFKIDLKRLQAWNPRSNTLRPGQMLTLYLP
ncbi:lytic transglycosylase domain-containing protein [Ectopseudomonas mendocina]|uniref:Lytic transglycosylase n=1 Tax=Ectopseudomonas mendocina S5.2 TaxID=1225174 RepID=A0ABM5VXA7_ECTME|nr:lytic transglycosylase domain-containing protein [Pseudomonas mendocina]ALN19533.1 lytic transglycosylase [Pseudomonas mendocina S5.2]KER99587.1 lytic transglycosylase [Pseudomonas mendocina]